MLKMLYVHVYKVSVFAVRMLVCVYLGKRDQGDLMSLLKNRSRYSPSPYGQN
jgi:hypothetical protein